MILFHENISKAYDADEPVRFDLRKTVDKALNQQPKPQKSHKRPKGKEQTGVE